MDEFVVADVVGTEAEAEVLAGLLRSAGIRSTTRQTNVGAGASDGLTTVGPYEVVVPAEDLDAAREVIEGDDDRFEIEGRSPGS